VLVHDPQSTVATQNALHFLCLPVLSWGEKNGTKKSD